MTSNFYFSSHWGVSLSSLHHLLLLRRRRLQRGISGGDLTTGIFLRGSRSLSFSQVSIFPLISGKDRFFFCSWFGIFFFKYFYLKSVNLFHDPFYDILLKSFFGDKDWILRVLGIDFDYLFYFISPPIFGK